MAATFVTLLTPFFSYWKIADFSYLELRYSKSDFTGLFSYVSSITFFFGAKRPILSKWQPHLWHTVFIWKTLPAPRISPLWQCAVKICLGDTVLSKLSEYIKFSRSDMVMYQTHKYVHITHNMSTHKFECLMEIVTLDKGNYGKVAMCRVLDAPFKKNK